MDEDRIITSQALIFTCNKDELHYEYKHVPRVPMNEYSILHPVKTILSPAGEVMTGFDLRHGNIFSHTPPFKLKLEAAYDDDAPEPVWSDKQSLIIKRMGEVIENSFRHNLRGIMATTSRSNKCYEAERIYQTSALYHIFFDVYEPLSSIEESKAVPILTEDDLFPNSGSEHKLGQIWTIRHRNTESQRHFIIFYFDRGIYGLIDYTGLKFLDLNGFMILFENSQSLGYQWQMLRLTPLPSSQPFNRDFNVLSLFLNMGFVATTYALTSAFFYGLDKYFFSNFNTDDAPVIKKKKKRDRPSRSGRSGNKVQANPPKKPKGKDRCKEVCKDKTTVETEQQKLERQKRIAKQEQEQKQRLIEAQYWEQVQRRLSKQKSAQERDKQQQERDNQERERQKALEKKRQEEQEQTQQQIQEREQRVSQEQAQALLRDLAEAFRNGAEQSDIEHLLLEQRKYGWHLSDLIHVIMNEDRKFRIRFKLRTLFKDGVLNHELTPFEQDLKQKLQS
ncbi:hypothetical protein [Endozoicomonas lisbonensis]